MTESLHLRNSAYTHTHKRRKETEMTIEKRKDFFVPILGIIFFSSFSALENHLENEVEWWVGGQGRDQVGKHKIHGEDGNKK
jgi:hypothetical protein